MIIFLGVCNPLVLHILAREEFHKSDHNILVKDFESKDQDLIDIMKPYELLSQLIEDTYIQIAKRIWGKLICTTKSYKIFTIPKSIWVDPEFLK